jgi:uncharacterized membrane protein YcaP (DUF421 family)
VKHDRLKQARIGVDEVMVAARAQGLTRLADVRHAILEAGGGISIIPRQS